MTYLSLPLQDPTIWAALAAKAMGSKELNTAEVAFAAIDEVDKLHFVLKVRWFEARECLKVSSWLQAAVKYVIAYPEQTVGCHSEQVKQIPTEEGRNAELALYRRRPDEAEAILIQVGEPVGGVACERRPGFLSYLISPDAFPQPRLA